MDISHFVYLLYTCFYFVTFMDNYVMNGFWLVFNTILKVTKKKSQLTEIMLLEHMAPAFIVKMERKIEKRI